MRYVLDEEYHLRSLRREDLDQSYLNWFEDELVCRFNRHGTFPMSSEDVRAFGDSLSTKERVVWGIFSITEGLVGNVGVYTHSWVDRVAELSLIIGVPDHWGKGVGTKACEAALRHGFIKMNLNRFFLGVASKNSGMVRLAENLGFQLEGRLRDHRYIDGVPDDTLMFGLLRSEFISSG